MLDLLKFDITAQDRTAAAFGRIKSELGGVKGALVSVNDYARRTGRSMQGIGAGMSAAITTPIAGLALAGRNAAISMRDLKNEATLAGIDPQQFAVLALATEEFGVSQSKLSDILKDVNDKMGDYLQTGKGPMQDFFDNIAPKVGLTEEAFKGLSSSQALRKYISALEEANVSQAEMTFYLEALASDATALLPAFAGGGAAIQEVADAASRLGLSLEKGLLDKAGDVERDFRIASRVVGLQFKQAMLGLAPAVAEVGSYLKPLLENVGKAANWFSNLEPSIQRNVVVFGGLAAAAGPALAVLGTATLGVSALATAFTGLGAALLANPVLAVIAAVAGGAYLIYRNWDSIRQWFSKTWESLKNAASSGWASIKSTLAEFTPKWIKDAWSGLATWFDGTWASVRTGFSIAWSGISGLLAGRYSPEQLVYAPWRGIGDWFRGLGGDLTSAFQSLWESLKNAASSGWASIKSTLAEFTPKWIKDAWSGLATWFDGTWASVQTGFSIAWSGISGLLAGRYSPEQLVYAAWRGIGDWFRGLGGELTTAFKDLWEAIRTEVSEWPGRMIELGKDLISGLVEGIGANAPTVGSRMRKVMRDMTGVAKDEVDSNSPSRVFMGIGKDIMDGLGVGIAENAQTALAQMRSVSQTLIAEGQRSTGFLVSFRDGAKSIFTSVLTGAQKFRGAFAGALSGFGNRLIGGAVDSLFDAVWPFAKGAAFSGGRVTAFASGGVISSPTAFPMRGGMGLMGEAGPEAIMPLSRGPDGKLGVRAQGAGGGDTLQFTFAPVVDARGADEAAVARLEAAVGQLYSGFEARVHQTLRQGRNRGLNRQWAGAS